MYDVLVIGAGHAGVEAALAAVRLKQKVALLTNNPDRIAFMSCNPSIGGLGKGHMVFEVDALGGLMGQAADATCLQFKQLNARKGPAVRGSRMQCDKKLYSRYVHQHLLKLPGLKIVPSEAKSLIVQKGCCCGVQLQDGSSVLSRTVVLAAGTFMRAMMHFGLKQIEGGRIGDKATHGLSQQLQDCGFNVLRLKTGTPARLHKDSIDWSVLDEQTGDAQFRPFSFKSPLQPVLPQIKCYISATNERTHEIIHKNLHLSPLFSGKIEGIGPRYCPSIEDKLIRFKNKTSHQTFLEPEALDTDSIYLQGLSTSLPEAVQYEFLRSMKGLQNVKILKPGYAVEYDFIEPTQIAHTLEARNLPGLFLAGQVNGTSGYEEAAGQGLMAGANAALKNLNQNEFVLRRDEAYIGVLIDDLVTKGTREPYRMMTSRAEYRLVLRQDNVFERLAHKAYQVGLLGEADFSHIDTVLNQRNKLFKHLDDTQLMPKPGVNKFLTSLGTMPIGKPTSLKGLLRRDELNLNMILDSQKVHPAMGALLSPASTHHRARGYPASHTASTATSGVAEPTSRNRKPTKARAHLSRPTISGRGTQETSNNDEGEKFNSLYIYEPVEIKIKYEGYIQRQQELIDQSLQFENKSLPRDIDYNKVKGLSREEVEKLSQKRPFTLGQALRISGVNPSAAQALLVHLKAYY